MFQSLSIMCAIRLFLSHAEVLSQMKSNLNMCFSKQKGERGYPGAECAKGMQGPKGVPGPRGMPGKLKSKSNVVFIKKICKC